MSINKDEPNEAPHFMIVLTVLTVSFTTSAGQHARSSRPGGEALASKERLVSL